MGEAKCTATFDMPTSGEFEKIEMEAIAAFSAEQSYRQGYFDGRAYVHTPPPAKPMWLRALITVGDYCAKAMIFNAAVLLLAYIITIWAKP
jgi:hypothetical protein